MPLKTVDQEFEWRRVSSWCGAVGAGFGVLGLVSWATNQPVVSSLSFHGVPMSPGGGLAFVLLGLALFLHTAQPPARAAQFSVSTFAVLVLVIGAMGVVLIFARA